MIKLSLFLVLIITAASDCPSDSSIPGLYANSLTLQSMSSLNSFSYNFNKQFMNQPNIALGILDLAYDGSPNLNMELFNVMPSMITRSTVMFMVNPSNGDSWNRIKINFWASERNDMILGFGSADLGSIQGNSVTRSISTPAVSNPMGSISRPLLNGFSLNAGSTEIDIHIQGTQIKANQLSVRIIAGPKSNLKQVWFSYIIFSPSSLPFASYGGLAAEIAFTGTAHTNIHTIIHETDNHIAGLTKLKANSNRMFHFTSEIDSDLILSYSNDGNAIDFFVTYLVVGMAPGKLCASCNEKFAFKGQCVKNCPANTYSFTYGDRGQGCRKCSSKLNERLKADRSGCEKSSTPSTTFNPFNTAPAVSQPTPSSPAPAPSISGLTSDSCKVKENSYWTGYRCACRVGYRENRQTATCDKIIITFPKPKILPIPKCSETEFFNGVFCDCLPQHLRNANGVCVLTIECPAFSTYINRQCVCNQGYKKVGNQCIPDLVCGENQEPDGMGGCKCKAGYYLDSVMKKCVFGEPCPQHSTRSPMGVCQCNDGYVKTSTGICARCPEGQFYDGAKCIVLCGINQFFNIMTGQCKCKEGFGFVGDACSVCPDDYFILNQFCVLCPINSMYDPASRGCVCKDGFNLVMGICVEKCGSNEVYFPSLMQCRCFEGLGRVNGECQVCPGNQNPNPQTQECSGCSTNQVLSNGQCVCASGFGFNANNECVRCEDNGFFLIDGLCASCPGQRIFDGTNCVCPSGFIEVNGLCTQQCEENQLIDQNGICYFCPLNSIPVNGVCQCLSGFTQDPVSGICIIQCQPNQFVISGICGVCILNSIYDPTLEACVCPEGFYRNNFGVCQQSVPTPVTCDPGFYFAENEGCVACPGGCQTCSDANTCLTCSAAGFVPQGGSCVANCGDGVIVSPEQCDDSNQMSGDGCSSTCMREANFICVGQPSVCTTTVTVVTTVNNCGNGQRDTGETCDDGNQNSGDGCSSTCQTESGFDCDNSSPSVCTRGAVNIQKVTEPINNSAAVYLTIRVADAFVFNTEQEMRNFIRPDFSSGNEPTSAFCNQRSGMLEMFDCVFLYPSGVPLNPFTIELTYSKENKNGYISIPVDTSQSMFASRSLN